MYRVYLFVVKNIDLHFTDICGICCDGDKINRKRAAHLLLLDQRWSRVYPLLLELHKKSRLDLVPCRRGCGDVFRAAAAAAAHETNPVLLS